MLAVMVSFAAGLFTVGLPMGYVAIRAWDQSYNAGVQAGRSQVLDAWAERSGASYEELRRALERRQARTSDGG